MTATNSGRRRMYARLSFVVVAFCAEGFRTALSGSRPVVRSGSRRAPLLRGVGAVYEYSCSGRAHAALFRLRPRKRGFGAKGGDGGKKRRNQNVVAGH